MLRKILALTITILILTSAFAIVERNFSSASTADPASLRIYIGPTSVLADGNTYSCIFIQLLDSSQKPTRAPEDLTISLSSSLTNVGTVDSSVTILKGTTYASANFYSTLTSGTTTITASATGYSTVQATITTITPIPSAIAVFGFPSTLPADGGIYPAIMVQLQDSGGSPQRAPPGGVDVMLSCSQLNVGSVSPSEVTIPYGSTYAIANFTTTTTPSTIPATITTQANGYASKTVQITTKSVTTSPKNLQIFFGPSQILADNNSYPQIAVELQDVAGNVALATSNVTIALSSSELSIGQINSSLTIGPQSQFQTYGIATFNTTFKAGSTIIVATATDFNHNEQTINTVEFIPPKLAVFSVPSVLPSDNAAYSAIQVQLQDSRGRPAKNVGGDITISLFSQNPDTASISSTLTIPSGKTQATANLTVTNAPGATTITAQTSGYSTGQAQVTTYVIDYTTLHVTLSANPMSISSANNANLTAYITGDGTPVAGATVTFASNNGGTFTATTEQGTGYYTATFSAPNFSQTTTCTITATAAKTNYFSGQGTVQISVTPAPVPTATPTPTAAPTSAPGSPTPTPTAAPVSASSQGTISLCIKDSKGNPLNNTLVSTTAQPAGMQTLIDMTNATGFVVFQNATAGSYTFKIISTGYAPLNETIDYSGEPLTLTIPLASSVATSNNSSNNSLIVIIAVISIVVVAAVICLAVLKRKTSPNVQKLKTLKKQMNYKNEP